MQDAVGARNDETKTKVFISYSRKDMAFADKLEAALKARSFEVLIDPQEIYAFEDWWKRIQALIGQSDTVVFMLSPDSVKSYVALKELAHAASLNKRFAPIVCRRVEDDAVPDALRRLNFIFFDDPDRFDEHASRLADALRTDIGWVRQHIGPQGGDIEVPKRARIGSVDQEHPATPVSILDMILAADTRRDAFNAQLETAAPEELAEIYHELSVACAFSWPTAASFLLSLWSP